MGGLRDFFKKRPAAAWALVVVLVAALGYLAAGRLAGRRAAPVAAPAPPAAPASPQAAAPVPAPAVPQIAPPRVVPSGPTGRVDPFVPLVRAPIPGGGPSGGTPPPPPPSTTLPPPPFPLPPGTLPPPPPPGVGLPPPPGTPPPPPPSPGEGIVVSGIVGNAKAVAIISVGGRTEIVSAGETIGTLLVVKIDPVRRTVTFSRAGRRFDVRMGGE